MTQHTIPPAARAGRHASFLAGCSIGGIRVALAPDTGGGEAEFKAAATMLRDKYTEVKAFADESRQRMTGFDHRLLEVEQRAVRRGGGSGGSVGDGFSDTGRSLGAELAASDALREFKSANYRGTSKFETKTTITSAVGSVGGALGGLIPIDRGGVQAAPRRTLSVRSLCRQLRTDSNQVTVMLQNNPVNAAAVAPENTLKGEGSLTYSEKVFPVATIATWVPVTRQALDDAAGLQALIDTDLRTNLAEREEDQFLYGNGASGNLFGLFPQATPYSAPFTVAAETPYDRLLMALAQASVANYRPSAILLNTADMWRLRASKDTQGNYIGNGPHEGLADLLWSLPWVGSNAVTPNDFLVGDFANAAEIYDKLDAVLMISDSHSDFFTRNLLAVLAEQRCAFVVRDSRAFIKGNLVTA
jgi:HK97 family phage major capsid protein